MSMLGSLERKQEVQHLSAVNVSRVARLTEEVMKQKL